MAASLSKGIWVNQHCSLWKDNVLFAEPLRCWGRNIGENSFNTKTADGLAPFVATNNHGIDKKETRVIVFFEEWLQLHVP